MLRDGDAPGAQRRELLPRRHRERRRRRRSRRDRARGTAAAGFDEGARGGRWRLSGMRMPLAGRALPAARVAATYRALRRASASTGRCEWRPRGGRDCDVRRRTRLVGGMARDVRRRGLRHDGGAHARTARQVDAIRPGGARDQQQIQQAARSSVLSSDARDELLRRRSVLAQALDRTRFGTADAEPLRIGIRRQPQRHAAIAIEHRGHHRIAHVRAQ